MLKVFCEPDLPHELVLVTIHAGELSDVGKHILEPISQLVSINVSKAVLHMRVDNQLGQTKDLATIVNDHTSRNKVLVVGHGDVIDKPLLRKRFDLHYRHEQRCGTTSTIHLESVEGAPNFAGKFCQIKAVQGKLKGCVLHAGPRSQSHPALEIMVGNSAIFDHGLRVQNFVFREHSVPRISEALLHGVHLAV